MKNLVLGVILFLTVMGGGIAVAADNSSTASNYKIESNGLNITPPVTVMPTVAVAQGLTDEKCRTFLVGAIEAGYDLNTIRDFIRTRDEACYTQLNNAVDAIAAGQTQQTYTSTDTGIDDSEDSTNNGNTIDSGTSMNYGSNTSYTGYTYKSKPLAIPTQKPVSFVPSAGTSYTDSLGYTHYSGADGVIGTAHTNSLGYTHYNDSEGNSVTAHTNSLGYTNAYDNNGNSMTAHTNSLGYTNYYGSDGYSASSHTNSLGYTNYSDNQGNSMSCRTNSLGYTNCN